MHKSSSENIVIAARLMVRSYSPPIGPTFIGVLANTDAVGIPYGLHIKTISTALIPAGSNPAEA